MSRAERIGNNENLFREVNERIEELGERFGIHESGKFRIVCECASEDCAEPIDIVLADYRSARENPRFFLVVPGHVVPEFENVVEDRGDYQVIEKAAGEPARIAEEGARKL